MSCLVAALSVKTCLNFAAEVLPSAVNRVFLAAEWRYLAMLNYAVDPALLAAVRAPGH